MVRISLGALGIRSLVLEPVNPAVLASEVSQAVLGWAVPVLILIPGPSYSFARLPKETNS